MAVGYQKTNFAQGTLASTLTAGASQLTVTAGHSLPTSGTFQLVIWDAITFPNPSDDSGVEIVTGAHNAGNVYDITRAQESTADVEHAAGEKVGLHYTAAVNVDDLDAANHLMARIAGSTYSTVQHLQDIFHSAGWVSGGGITDDADGTITVAAGTGLIRASDSAVVQIVFTDWAAESGANVALADNDINWVYVEYNSGSPQVVATTTERTDYNTNILLAVIQRAGTTLHINAVDKHTVGDHANSMIRRLKDTMPYGHVSGGILSETGTRNIALTVGSFWRGLTEFTTSAVDTSGAPTFSYYYNDGAWQKVASQSAIHQTNYNNFGVGLATLSNNKYGVHWVYIEADDDDIAVVYGIGDYTLAQAEDAQPPAAIPEHLQIEGILAGKIIIKEGGAAFTQTESAFQTKFTGSLATAHSSLTELDFASSGHTGTPTVAGIVVADGGSIGQSAGPLLTFNDTDNHLDITGCNVCIGDTIPTDVFEVRANKEAGTTVGDFLVDAANKIVYVGRLSGTGSDASQFVVRGRVGTAYFTVNAVTGQVIVGAGVPYLTSGAFFGTPDEITATDAGVAASLGRYNTEVTTNGDSDLDNVTLANGGMAGQIKHIYCVVEGNAADTWKITPATMVGGTQITFNGVGEGCILVYADNEGWVVVGNNGGTIS